MAVRSIMVALIGVAVAGASAFATREYLTVQTATAEVNPAAELTNVVIASSNIAVGQSIDAPALSVIPWPRAALPPGAYQTTTGLLPAEGQPARRATKGFAKGELILASKVSAFGGKVTIVQKLTQGMRAMAIKVNAVTAVGGFVTPGDHVDIVLTQGNSNDLRAVTILQDIRILGVDQVSDQNSDKPSIARTVTVEVSPNQGQILALAQHAGTLSLTLRAADASPTDVNLASIRLRDVLRDSSPVDVKKPGQTIKVRRGDKPAELVEVQ